jgi:hypothetical protein
MLHESMQRAARPQTLGVQAIANQMQSRMLKPLVSIVRNVTSTRTPSPVSPRYTVARLVLDGSAAERRLRLVGAVSCRVSRLHTRSAKTVGVYGSHT